MKKLMYLLLLVGLFFAGKSIFSKARMAQNVQTVSAPDFEKKLESMPGALLLDVRTPEEFNSGHLKSALNINFYDKDFSHSLEKLDKEKPVFVYCKAGSRSAEAALQMEKMGFKIIVELKGGYMAWTSAEQPVESGEKTPAVDKFSSADFQQLISAEIPVLVDFYAEWCLPCKKMKPILELLEYEYNGEIIIKRINVDEAKELSNELGIKEIPVVSAYRSGSLISTHTGYQSEAELRTIIRNLLQ